MAKAIALREPEPMSAINITPLIDVMLVLLIMMILTIPIATHKIAVDLPQGPATNPIETPPHQLAIDNKGKLFWDAVPVSDAALPGLLANAQREQPEMVLHMRTDPDASYDRFAHILAVVKRSGVTRLGFLGNRPLAL